LQLASGLSTPVGFCGTVGAVSAAADAVRAASTAHAFLSVSKQGVAGIVETTGNRSCHVVLPPSAAGKEEDAALTALGALELPSCVMVDCGII